MAQVVDGVEIDLSDERFGRGVPFEMLAALRRSAPVFWYEAEECWVLTSFAFVEAANRDYRVFSSAGGPIPPEGRAHQTLPIMLADDPPVHTTYRRLVSRGWSPRAIAGKAERVDEIVNGVVKTFVEKGGGDFISEVAGPIPFEVIAEMVGVPLTDAPLLWQWTNAIIPSKDPDYRVDAESAQRAAAEFDEYAGEILEHHRRHPRADLAGALLELEREDEPLTEREMRDFLLLYVTGGSETTKHLLSHTIAAFFDFPEQRRRLVEGEVTSAAAVEEMLRWSTPVLHHSRWATEDVELGGQLIEEGQRVTLWMISANFDETVFAEPTQLDLGRSPNPQVSFGGGGPHHCLGAHLARLEATLAFDELRPYFDRLRLDGEIDHVMSNFFNGIKRLPLVIE